MLNRIKAALGGGELDKPQLDALLEQAVQALREGAPPEHAVAPLEQTLTRLRDDAPGTSLLAHAYYNTACVSIAVGDHPRAVQHLRAAAGIPGSDPTSSKDQLTYLMNLGDVLTRMGEDQEAEAVLRDGLAKREAFYGADHAGVAFGLTPLAANLLQQGRGAEALPLIDRAVAINGAAGQPEVAADLALRAFVIKQAQGPQAVGFESWSEWDADFQAAVLEGIRFRADAVGSEAEAKLLVEVLREISPQLAEELPLPARLNVQIMLSNAAQQVGDTPTQLASGQRVLELAEAHGDPGLIVNSLEGLAFAHDHADDPAAAEACYRRAVETAGADPHLRSNALRNMGLFFSERERFDQAAATLTEAVAAAAAAGDPEIHGRCLTAQGIYLQHRGQLTAATPLLRQAVDMLPPVHPDRFCAMTHLLSVEREGACGCNEAMGQAAAGAIMEEIVRRSAPPGLLESIAFGDDGIHVQLAREPQPDEVALLNRLIELAMAQFRQAARRA